MWYLLGVKFIQPRPFLKDFRYLVGVFFENSRRASPLWKVVLYIYIHFSFAGSRSVNFLFSDRTLRWESASVVLTRSDSLSFFFYCHKVTNLFHGSWSGRRSSAYNTCIHIRISTRLWKKKSFTRSDICYCCACFCFCCYCCRWWCVGVGIGYCCCCYHIVLMAVVVVVVAVVAYTTLVFLCLSTSLVFGKPRCSYSVGPWGLGDGRKVTRRKKSFFLHSSFSLVPNPSRFHLVSIEVSLSITTILLF